MNSTVEEEEGRRKKKKEEEGGGGKKQKEEDTRRIKCWTMSKAERRKGAKINTVGRVNP